MTQKLLVLAGGGLVAAAVALGAATATAGSGLCPAGVMPAGMMGWLGTAASQAGTTVAPGSCPTMMWNTRYGMMAGQHATMMGGAVMRIGAGPGPAGAR